jgi:hypothetical protein
MKKSEVVLFFLSLLLFSNICSAQINSQILGLFRYEQDGVRGEMNIDYDAVKKNNSCTIQMYASKNVNGYPTWVKINGLYSKGTYLFNKETNELKIKWVVPLFNKAMSSWTLNTDVEEMKLINNQKEDIVYYKIIPTLCDCLKAPGGNASKDIPRGCKNVIMNQYGTAKPTLDQMRADYNACP